MDPARLQAPGEESFTGNMPPTPFLISGEEPKKSQKFSDGSKNSMKVARPKGFEPLTPRFVVWCSIQLSYGRLVPPPGGARDAERPCSYRFRDVMARDRGRKA